MVIDSVEFALESGSVRHHEIEVEAKAAGTAKDIQEVSNTLLSHLPGALRAWHHGKRTTGRAAGVILSEHGTSGMMSASGDLLPGAYDRILAKIR
jgi:hypothetical protein